MKIINVSTIIATKDRPDVLLRTLNSIAAQTFIPIEIIVVDASVDNRTKNVCGTRQASSLKIIHLSTTQAGAAVQRLQGMEFASHPIIWFCDDDILLEEHCIQRMWEGFSSIEHVGAVNAMITNQKYTSPGRVTRLLYRFMSGVELNSYAGKVIGPAWNLLPEDNPLLPEYVECEWLNTTCTMYKRSAMPEPVFPKFFQGYSLMEDVTLSVLMAKKYVLLNARTARIYHDSQPGTHKNNIKELSCMELMNRHFVMTKILNRLGFKNYVKLTVLEIFGIVSNLRSKKQFKDLPLVLAGKFDALRSLLFL